MSSQLVAHIPQARCYKCGSTEIANVCHHCARAMCAADSPKVEQGDGAASLEFVGLGLRESNIGETAIHCENCAHAVRGQSRFLLVGILVSVVSLFLFNANAVLGFFGLIVGPGLAATDID